MNMCDMAICGIWECVGYGNVGDMGICGICEYGDMWDMGMCGIIRLQSDMFII